MPTSRNRLALPVLTLTAAAATLIACGGGGGGDAASAPPLVNFGNSAPLPTDIAGTGALSMTCADGVNWQCSGAAPLRAENGVAVTASGVQTYGQSTSDLLPTNPDVTRADGFETVPNGNGVAEIRIRKNATDKATVEQMALLLGQFGIKWDGVHERPQVIEAFDKTAGISSLVGGALATGGLLHDHTDTAWYDFGTNGTGANQAHYANNRYFPRTSPPIRNCPTVTCANEETTGIHYTVGDFRTAVGGTDPDRTSGHRLHSEGDVAAGDHTGGANQGVPYPGNKGYRDLQTYSFNYANLGTWLSQETTEVDEWTGRFTEHVTNRRGAAAFGETTLPAAVRGAGGANYRGVAYGWYTTNGTDAVYYTAAATISVNFDSRQVAVQISNATSVEQVGTPVSISLTTTVGMGKSGDNVANYFTGSVNTGGNAPLTGGLGGRFFGPSVQVSADQGPAEIGGTFTLTNSTTKAATVGGFIARLR